MVGAMAMPTGSRPLPHARRLVTPAFFQRNPVYARGTFHAIILTNGLENAKNSSMVDAEVMRTTLQLKGHAIKNVATRKKGKNCLKDNMAEMFSVSLQQNVETIKPRRRTKTDSCN